MEVNKIIIGYARVSTQDQSLDAQIQAIEDFAKRQQEKYRIFQEKESGGKTNRKELQYALDLLTEGDTFVVYKLDRLARSTRQLIETVEEIGNKGADFTSLNDQGMDTTTANGRLMFQVMAAVAEFERAMIQERTKAGLEAARRQRRNGGRATIDDETKKSVKALFDGGRSATKIAVDYNIGRTTVYKIINEFKNKGS